MSDELISNKKLAHHVADGSGMPEVVDRATFQAKLDGLRIREKLHTREGDAIAAARRRLPMVEVDANLALIGPDGPLNLLEAFEGRQQLIAYYFMWNIGRPAIEQCEGCTWIGTQVSELSYLHSRDITYAVLAQGPYAEDVRYRDFHGLGHAVVLGLGLGRQTPCRARGRAVPPRVLHARWRPGLRNLLDDPARRRGNGHQLGAHGPYRVRSSSGVGRRAPRLASALECQWRRRHPAH